MKLIIKELPTGNKGNIFHLENWVCWISSHQAVGREAQTCTGSKNEYSMIAAKSLERVRAGFLFHLVSSLMRLNRTSIVSYQCPWLCTLTPIRKKLSFYLQEMTKVPKRDAIGKYKSQKLIIHISTPQGIERISLAFLKTVAEIIDNQGSSHMSLTYDRSRWPISVVRN